MKQTIRNVFVLAAIILTLPMWLTVRFGIIFGINTFTTWGMLLSLMPGLIGNFLRRGYYVMTLRKLSWDCGIDFGSWFSKREVNIGPKVSIGANCIIGICCIGEGTLIGSNVDILSGRHQHGKSDEVLEPKQSRAVFSPVYIGKNVWIGNRAVIMAHIGENSIIGAGSVVVKSVPENSIAVGNPAVNRHVKE